MVFLCYFDRLFCVTLIMFHNSLEMKTFQSKLENAKQRGEQLCLAELTILC